MATPVAAATTGCSKCTIVFSDGLHLAGACSTCRDGDLLCQNCADQHTQDARFAGHDYRALKRGCAADFLARMQLVPAPKACSIHQQQFLNLRCAACSAKGMTYVGLCAACVYEHTLAHPTHSLTPSTTDAALLRDELVALAALPTANLHELKAVASATAVSVAQPSQKSTVVEAAAQSAPLVESARLKAFGVRAELDALDIHTEAALAQLEANGDAVIAAVKACVEASCRAVHVAAASKRCRLEDELVAADAGLCAATTATASLAEVWLDRKRRASLLDYSPRGTNRRPLAQYLAGCSRA